MCDNSHFHALCTHICTDAAFYVTWKLISIFADCFEISRHEDYLLELWFWLSQILMSDGAQWVEPPAFGIFPVKVFLLLLNMWNCGDSFSRDKTARLFICAAKEAVVLSEYHIMKRQMNVFSVRVCWIETSKDPAQHLADPQSRFDQGRPKDGQRINIFWRETLWFEWCCSNHQAGFSPRYIWAKRSRKSKTHSVLLLEKNIVHHHSLAVKLTF